MALDRRKPSVAIPQLEKQLNALLNSKIFDNQEIFEKLAEQKMLSVDIVASHGNMLTDIIPETKLSARVTSWGADITDKVDKKKFIWKRISGNTLSDNAWTLEHSIGMKEVTLTKDDVGEQATFFCSVSDDTGIIAEAQIVVCTSIRGEALAGVVTQYYLSTSKTECVDSEWTYEQPVWSDGKYIWVRYEKTDLDGNVEYTQPVIADLFNKTSENAYNSLKTAESVKSDVNTLKLWSENAQTAIEQNTDQIELRATKQEVTDTINAIDIGGRNLILDSGQGRISSDSLIATYEHSIPLVTGKVYTVTLSIIPAENMTSVDVKLSQGNALQVSIPVSGTNEQTVSATFDALYADGYTPDDAEENAFLMLYRNPESVTGETTVNWIKVEKGNKSTDWTPAPEDTNSIVSKEIETASSDILQTANEITMSILSGYTKSSDLEKYKEQVNNLFSMTEEGFSFDFNRLQLQIDALGGEIVNQSSYIKLIDGEVRIGRDGNPVTSVFTNNALEFRYNNETVARFTNETLEVRNISAENQVAFYDQWAIRKGAYITGKGYNLNDMWIGG